MINVIHTALTELLGLFVEDGSLAAVSVLLLALLAGLIEWGHLDPLAGAALLLIGCLAALVASVYRYAMRERGRAS